MTARGETEAGTTAPPRPARAEAAILRRAIAALGLTQLVGWGTTYYLPAILADAMAAGTGLPRTAVFGGVTIMLLVSAAAAPAVGRRLAVEGARRGMVLGSGLVALGLAVLAGAHGPLTFALAWTILGLAAPLALTQAATTAMVQIARDDGRDDGARRAITLLSLFSGLASTASWPVLIWLEGAVGWRASVLAYAGFHLMVAAPLHALVLPRRSRDGAALARAAPGAGTPLTPPAPPRPVPGAFALAAATFALAGIVSWGLPLHVVTILRAFGHSPGAAVAIGAVLGPAQICARLIDLAGARRVDILAMGVAAAALMPLAILALMAGALPAAAVGFAAGYGLSAGTMTIVRAVAPLRLFGREAYAVVTGRLAVPQNVAFAAAPLAFAGLGEALGPRALLGVALAVSLLALATMVTLARRAGALAAG